MLRYLTRNAPLVGMLMFAGACADGSAPLDCVQAEDALLFSQPARSAVIEEENGALRLTLREVGRTIWFADRPNWDAGLVDTGAFVQLWDDFGIEEGAPSVVTRMDGDLVMSTTVALSDPIWNEAERTLSYRLREFAEDRGVGALAPGQLGEVTVLIDPTVLAGNCAPDLEPDVLFVQAGLSGDFPDTEGGLMLRLRGVAATQFFSSDPDRAGGVVQTGAFVDDWAASTETARAVLNIPNRADGPALVELELAEPRYEDGTLSFRVVELAGEARSARAVPEGFADAALFLEAFDTPINGDVAHAVTEPLDLSDVDPATAFGTLYIQASQAISQAAENAINNQEQGNVAYQAAITAGVEKLLDLDTASTGIASSDLFP